MSLTLYRVSAFPNGNIGGNEAGVVLDADSISEQHMLEIAARVNFSETAFVLKSDVADYKLRYFSPTLEVPLCGHATIATFNLMRNLDKLDKSHYTIETNEGILDIFIHPDQITMQLKKPKFLAIIPKEAVIKALKIDPSLCLDSPVQVVSTGIKEIFLGVKSLEALRNLNIKSSDIEKLCKDYQSKGLYIFTLETLEGGDAHGRNFIPLLGIKEESATGTASGALASYLNKYHNPDKLDYIFEQGYTLLKPSRIRVSLKKTDHKITNVFVGGTMRLIDKIIGFNPNK